MSELDPVYVLDAMRRLCKTQPEVFGKLGHNFLLNPPLSEAAVADFEARQPLIVDDQCAVSFHAVCASSFNSIAAFTQPSFS